MFGFKIYKYVDLVNWKKFKRILINPCENNGEVDSACPSGDCPH